MIAVNMTAYPSVRKPALDAPEPIELEFARDTLKFMRISGNLVEVPGTYKRTALDLLPPFARPRCGR
jgi:hypothetical protein